MGSSLGPVNFDRWPTVWVAGSLIGLVAAIGSGNPIYVGFALGSLLFGMGELVSHPKQQRFGYGAIITGYPRRWSLFGTILDILGIGIMVLSAYKAGLFG